MIYLCPYCGRNVLALTDSESSMDDVAYLELKNMILVAQRDASDGKHTADKAFMQVSAHEQLCTERYSNINRQLGSLPDIYSLINKLNATANKAVGCWLGLVGLCVMLGGIYTVFKLTHGG